jgi:membrane fusion protein (multidrug efflux system)
LSDNEVRAAPQAPRARRRSFLVIPVILALVLAATGYWLVNRGRVSTDDAQVDGDIIPISSRVSGYVDSIKVAENERVEAGQILVLLDRRDLSARVAQGEAALAAQKAQADAAAGQVSLVARTAPAGELQAQAGVSAAGAGIAASESQIASAQAQARSAGAAVAAAEGAVEGAESDLAAASAQVHSAEAALRVAQSEVVSAEAQANKADSDAARFRELYRGGAVSKQQLEALETAETTAQAVLGAARDRIDSAEAAVEQAKARRSGAEAGLGQARARLESAKASVAQAHAGLRLAGTGLSQAHAMLNEAHAGQSAAQTVGEQVKISEAQGKAAQARIGQAAADLHNAKLQLSYTQIVAPVSGVVSNKSVQPGQFVQPGQQLMALVPLEDVWVVANFKETQIGRMHPGQKATVKVDTYPGRKFAGRIDSIGPATGAEFSLLPPENATGNYVKVVQRIPVKIVLDQPIPPGVVLRPGQNVVATVEVGRG